MKKKINKIVISRDMDNEILVRVFRTQRNGIDLLVSTNILDAVSDIISDILYETGEYKLVQTPLPKYKSKIKE